MRMYASAVQDSIDLIAIALVAVEELVDRYEERVDVSGVEHAMVARASLAAMLASAQVDHEQRYSAGAL